MNNHQMTLYKVNGVGHIDESTQNYHSDGTVKTLILVFRPSALWLWFTVLIVLFLAAESSCFQQNLDLPNSTHASW